MVTVLLPAYNAQDFIRETIQSIIIQTYKDWELIIINDGSTDNTKDVVLSFKDERIKYYENDGNRKLIYTLNRGLKLATGKYIARMDSDDICYPTRFEKQVAFLESHPDVIVCGTQIEYFGTKSTNYRKLTFPSEDTALKDMLAISTCFAHPTVMIRRDALVKSGCEYDVDYKNAEDYSLWIDLMEYGKFANLSEKLLNYRVSDTQVSQPSNPITIASVLKCRRKYAEKFVKGSLVDELFSGRVDISFIKKLRKQCSSARILECCYLSLDKYTFSSLCYLLISGDWMTIGFKGLVRFCKRLMTGKDPIYYQI